MDSRTLNTIVAVLLVFLLTLAATAPARSSSIEKEFEESARFVNNPDCGWIAYNYGDSYSQRKRAANGSEPFPFASVVYTRHPRKKWQTKDGSFESSEPVRLLRDWMQHERHVAFRIYANSRSHLPFFL